MRFLLQGRKLNVKAIKANQPLASVGAAATKTFGQQCSPHCACVLRFEAYLSENGTVESASYFAKTLVCTQSKTTGHLEPIVSSYSSSARAQPLFVECTCPSLHKLAKQVTAHLHTKSFQKELRNAVEFTGNRSSLAFTHAVLHRFGLDTSATHCHDLVEDALTSMIRQAPAPKQRAAKHNFAQWLEEHYKPILSEETEESETEKVTRYGHSLRRQERKARHWIGKDRDASATNPRLLSALHLVDMDLLVEDDAPLLVTSSAGANQKKLDWETYVDEQYKRLEEDEQAQTA
jgi:hypothetical protein